MGRVCVYSLCSMDGKNKLSRKIDFTIVKQKKQKKNVLEKGICNMVH